jgi:hypothetical protein
MSAANVGGGKTDAKDAYVIAETARLRRDLAIIDADTDLVRHLAVLTEHRADLIADRARMINRLRDPMASVFPSLERSFDYSSHKGALALLTGFATLTGSARIGRAACPPGCETGRCAVRPRLPPRAVAAAKAQTAQVPSRGGGAGRLGGHHATSCTSSKPRAVS